MGHSTAYFSDNICIHYIARRATSTHLAIMRLSLRLICGFCNILRHKVSVVTSRVITWNDSQVITLLIIDKYNAQEPRTVNTINNGNITLLCIP
jgi:hypothetical protein